MAGFLLLALLFSGFPGESDADCRLISTRWYDDDWVETDDSWFGLFETDSTFELREVELQLSKSTAPLDEGERPHPFVVELVDEPCWPMFIISSSETEFIEGAVATAFGDHRLIVFDTSFVLEAPGMRETLLFATEEGLFLSDHVTCQSITDTHPGEDFSAHYIEVRWAGDLDRDGLVDLLINDVNDSYFRYNLCLLLSSAAGQDSLVKMVASFRDVYY